MHITFRSLLILTLGFFWGVAVHPIEARMVYNDHGQDFYWNDFSILNNQWGRKFANSGWYQRIVQEDNNTISFEYNWWGNTSKVKGYPAIIVGWHYGDPGNKYMTPYGFKNLPVKISDNQAFISGISASHLNFKNYEKMNISWDIWIAWSNLPNAPGNEIMIWPWRNLQLPLGSEKGKVETVSIWGTKWDLYSGIATNNDNSWYVFTFVKQTNTLDIKGNLQEFINYIWKTKGWLSGEQWIVGIECGTEIIEGQGSWNINSYMLSSPNTSAPKDFRMME